MNNPRPTPEPLAYSVAQVISITPWGRTRVYELINEGKLKSSKVGKRRLISAASLRALVEGEAA